MHYFRLLFLPKKRVAGRGHPYSKPARYPIFTGYILDSLYAKGCYISITPPRRHKFLDVYTVVVDLAVVFINQVLLTGHINGNLIWPELAHCMRSYVDVSNNWQFIFCRNKDLYANLALK